MDFIKAKCINQGCSLFINYSDYQNHLSKCIYSISHCSNKNCNYEGTDNCRILENSLVALQAELSWPHVNMTAKSIICIIERNDDCIPYRVKGCKAEQSHNCPDNNVSSCYSI